MSSNSIFPRMHVSLYVSDLQKTISFYTTFFGQEPAKVKPGYAKYLLDHPSLIISFVENKDRVQANFGHLGFQVETIEELNERLWKARSQGIVAKEETGTNCCYAKQDKFWATDPDGTQWEVYYFHEDADFNAPHYETEAASACCIAPGELAVGSDQLAVKKEVKPLVQLASIGLMKEEETCCTPGGGCC